MTCSWVDAVVFKLLRMRSADEPRLRPFLMLLTSSCQDLRLWTVRADSLLYLLANSITTPRQTTTKYPLIFLLLIVLTLPLVRLLLKSNLFCDSRQERWWWWDVVWLHIDWNLLKRDIKTTVLMSFGDAHKNRVMHFKISITWMF